MDKYLVRRILTCLVGAFIYASGITVVKVCQLGISPISSAPYAFSFVIGHSLGACTMYLNGLLFLFQKAIFKKEYTLRIFLTQLVLSFLFAAFIDLAGVLFGGFAPVYYLGRIAYLLFGCLVLAIGMCGVVMSGFGMLPGEGAVICIQKTTKLEFGICKIIFDSSMVVLSVIISLVFLGEITGVREGTLIAAFIIGWFSRHIMRIGKPHINKFLGLAPPPAKQCAKNMAETA